MFCLLAWLCNNVYEENTSSLKRQSVCVCVPVKAALLCHRLKYTRTLCASKPAYEAMSARADTDARITPQPQLMMPISYGYMAV